MVVFIIDGSERFLKTCENLRNNQPSLKKVMLVIAPNMSPENWSAAIESFRTNQTVQEFTLLVLPEVVLEDQNMHDLKDFIVNNRCCDTLLIHNISNERNDFSPLGRAICQSDFRSICLCGFTPNQNGLVAFCDNFHTKTCLLDIRECRLGSTDVDALAGLMKNGLEKAICFTGATFAGGSSDYCRIAQSLGEGATIFFKLVDEIKDECVAIAFGKALAKNASLLSAKFDWLCPMAVPHIVGGIENNLFLTGANVGGVGDNDADSDQVLIEAKARVAHAVAMNRVGRRYLRQSEGFHGNGLIEDFWSHQLVENKGSHTVVFSLIQEHPDFILSSLTLKEESEKNKLKPLIVLMETFSFYLFCFFYS